MGWLRNFNELYGIHMLKVQGEHNSTDHNAAENFTEEFQVSPEQVYKAPALPPYIHTLGVYRERKRRL